MKSANFLTTICYRLKNKNTYALEGSIFIAGAGVQWLRDKIKLINNAYETEKITKSKIDNEDGGIEADLTVVCIEENFFNPKLYSYINTIL